jgi:hypothetical protein
MTDAQLMSIAVDEIREAAKGIEFRDVIEAHDLAPEDAAGVLDYIHSARVDVSWHIPAREKS